MASTREKVDKLEAEITQLDKVKDKVQIKKLRNKISAYESRIGNRSTRKDLEVKLERRKLQLGITFRVLQEELPDDLLQRVLQKICRETEKLEIESE